MTLLQLITLCMVFIRLCATICFLKTVFASFVSRYISAIYEVHSYLRYTAGVFFKFPNLVCYNQRVLGFRVNKAELLHSPSTIMYVILLSSASVRPLVHQKFLGSELHNLNVSNTEA
jgi:hypothetical protein